MSTTVETSEEWANELKELDFGGVTEDLSHMQKEDLGIVDEDADAEDEPEVPNKKRKAAQELEDEDAKKAPKKAASAEPSKKTAEPAKKAAEPTKKAAEPSKKAAEPSKTKTADAPKKTAAKKPKAKSPESDDEEEEETKKLIKKVDKTATSAKIATATGKPKAKPAGGSSSDETVAAAPQAPRKAEDVFAARETELLSAEVHVAKALAVLAKANRAYALAELALAQSNKRKAAQRPQVSKRPAAASAAAESSGEDEDD